MTSVPATSKPISVSGDAVRALEEGGFDFVAHGFARVFDERSGRVTEWLRAPGLDESEVRQMDAIYRTKFPEGPSS